MQAPEHILSSRELEELLGADIMPLFRLLFSQMAASCAALAFALDAAASGKRVTQASLCCGDLVLRGCSKGTEDSFPLP